MELKYQIFGSASSLDVDIMVFVDSLKSIDKNHKLIKLLNIYFKRQFDDDSDYEGKTINCNLAVLKDGMIKDVFKGTYDECNNSLYHTYSFHKQFCKKSIYQVYDRTTEFFYHMKLKRVLRFILSFYSRIPELRTDIKSALKGDFKERLRVCYLVDLTKYTEFPKKKESIKDIYKVIAFQLAQIISLGERIEIYTKEEVCIYFPKLVVFIERKEFTSKDLAVLQHYFNQLKTISTLEMSGMEDLKEYL